jgi:hypothetical protein
MGEENAANVLVGESSELMVFAILLLPVKVSIKMVFAINVHLKASSAILLAFRSLLLTKIVKLLATISAPNAIQVFSYPQIYANCQIKIARLSTAPTEAVSLAFPVILSLTGNAWSCPRNKIA